MGAMRNLHKTLSQYDDRPKHKSDNNVKMDLQEMDYDGVY
jgi:hypothetical protein